MDIRLNPKLLMKYLDEELLLDAFRELVGREDVEIIKYMRHEITATIAFSDKEELKKLVN